MSKLWTTLKSVVGGVSPAAVEEVAAAASTAAVSSASAPPAPASSSDGMLHGFAAIKPHLPMIKFRKHLSPSEQHPVTPQAAPSPAAAAVSAPAGGSLEWWQIPDRCRDYHIYPRHVSRVTADQVPEPAH